MSILSNSDMNQSNLERKIQKNTFTSNSNNLKGRERSQSQISLFSRQSKIFSSISSNSSESDTSKQSILQLSLFKNPLRELDLTMAVEINETISIRLQELITSADSGIIIILPPRVITINSLIINDSLTLRGSPGSVIQVINGTISISSSLNQNYFKVCVAELSIVYESTCNVGIRALFSIESSISELEVSDCVIKQNNIKNDSNDNVCFLINSLQENIEFSAFNSKLLINSCSFSNFSEIIHGNEGSSVVLTKCHMSNCTKTGIVLINPKILQVSHCMIEKCKKNGIEILLSADSQNHSTHRTKSSSDRSILREITIERTDILNNNESGFILHSENLQEFNADLIIESNKIAHNKKEGLAIKHVIINSLKISNNDFNHNMLSGI